LFKVSCRFCLTLAVLACWLPSLTHAQTYGPNILPAGSFENVQQTFVPWAGVDEKGNIHGFDGSQISVGDDGNIRSHAFGPSAAVADMTGSGKQDLVLADAYGFFWFFPNSGTVRSPAFTQGEIIPIWLGQDRLAKYTEGVENYVPRIQLADFANNNLLDILVGDYAGKLFRIPNIGTPSQPNFKPTLKPDELLINTRKDGELWCNYLSPCITGLFNPLKTPDLVMGDGGYSANSVYLFRNTGSKGAPAFDEDHMQKIIPGMGLEQLTPAVVDWNNDGKPDIICGDRTGSLTLYLNNSTDPANPTFAHGTHIRIGGQENFGGSITVAIGDLSGNHLPNLLIGKDDGTVLYAENSGKLGAPSFILPATPLKGVLPPDYHYITPTNWYRYGAYGAPDEVLACTNPQIEPGFTFPEGENSKYALKFYVWPVKNTYFPERYYPAVEDFWREHVISCTQKFKLNLNKTYRIHFWVRAEHNVADFRYKFYPSSVDRVGFHGYEVINPAEVGTNWKEVSDEIKINDPDDPTVTNWIYNLEFHFTGQTTLYIEDVQIQEKLQ